MFLESCSIMESSVVPLGNIKETGVLTCKAACVAGWQFRPVEKIFSSTGLLRTAKQEKYCLVSDRLDAPTQENILCTGGAYYVPYSCLLIVMGGSGPSRANKFIYAPTPPPPPPQYGPWNLPRVFGPQMALAYWLDAISQCPKNSRIPGPNPLPLALVMDMHASKTLCTGLYKS